ncbi:MAG TPA: WYL domain-containing protein [Actinomycetota bacterium]
MPEAARPASRTAERLGRMLVVVPYLVQHPGSELATVARLFGVPPDQLRRDLSLLFMSGLPPYGPGDLIDVDVDEEDQIWITMADHFARPLHLTRNEALALYLRGTELLATPGLPEAPALASALAKLRDSLGPDVLGEADGAIGSSSPGTPPPFLDALRTASAEHRRLDIEYFAASTRRWSSRRIDPEEVFSAMGHWYVAAWDVDADGERLLRADRMRRVASTGETFQARGLQGAGRPLYSPGPDDVPARLLLHPTARWIAEYYVTSDPVERPDGSLEITLPVSDLDVIARLLLRVGEDATVLDPPELRDLTADLASRSLARYL